MRQKGKGVTGDVARRLEEVVFAFADNNMAEFARRIGTPRSTIYNITGGRLNHPSLELIGRILTSYPQLNPDWLIHGSGDMRRGDTPGVSGGSVSLSASDRRRMDDLLKEIKELRANIALTK